MQNNTLVSSMTMPDVQSLARKSFTKGLHKDQGDVRRLFHRKPCSWETNSIRITEVDRERFAGTKAEGQDSKKLGVGQGYSKEIRRKTISVERELSGEAMKALTAHGLAMFATSVGHDVVDRIELDMANFIGMGESTEYTDMDGFAIDTTTADGLSVFNNAHTLKFSSTTYSNILSGGPAFSAQSLESAEDYFNYNVLDNYGQRLKMKPNTIITSRKATMVHRVKRILGSMSPEKIGDDANENPGVMNTYKASYTHAVVDFDVDANNITDTTKAYWWFVAALNDMPDMSFQAYYCVWLSPETESMEYNKRAWTMYQVARSAYGIGAVSGKGILLVKGTG